MNLEDVIKRPLVLTEKGTTLRDRENKYFFEVDPRANKIEIKDAVEELFKVTVSRREHPGRARQAQADGPSHGQDSQLEESVRDPQRGHDRILRRSLNRGDQAFQANVAVASLLRYPGLRWPLEEGAGEGPPRVQELHGWTQPQRPSHLALPRWRTQAGATV